MITEQDISAQVYYTSPKSVHYVKIELFGMYISNIRVQRSLKNFDGQWWVQMPSFEKNGKWSTIIEFRPESELKTLITKACIKAVDQELDSGLVAPGESSDVVIDDLMTDEELKKQLDALPF